MKRQPEAKVIKLKSDQGTSLDVLTMENHQEICRWLLEFDFSATPFRIGDPLAQEQWCAWVAGRQRRDEKLAELMDEIGSIPLITIERDGERLSVVTWPDLLKLQKKISEVTMGLRGLL